MKKTIITMLIALVAMVASAETYNYLKFTKTNGSTVTYSVEGLKLTYDNTNVTVKNVEGTATIALAEVQDMYFSNEPGGSDFMPGDVNNDKEVGIADVMALIGIILDGMSGHDAATLMRADVNRDSEIQIADINVLIDLILN